MRGADLDWFAYLAGAVPPSELARAVTARARKVLAGPAQAVMRQLQRVRPGDGLGAPQLPSDQAAPLRGPRPSILDTSPRARERTARVARERWPRECAEILREARAAREGRLPVFGRLVDCAKEGGAGSGDAAPLDFDRDPLAREVRYDPTQEGPLVNLFQAGADAKAAWEVGRLSHLWRYGQARWLAHDPVERSLWARAFLATLRQFRADCPAGRGVQWSCAMEVSARAMHAALAFAFVEDDPVFTPAAQGEAAVLLGEHGRFIETHLEDTGAVRTNHYAADLVGLVVIGSIFPELPEARRWREESGRMLWEEVFRQVRPDGTHFESSSGYQRLCAELFLAAWLSARAAGAHLPRGLESRIAMLFRSAGELLKPSGVLPQLGDLDSCRGLPLLPRPALECGYLPALGAAALNEGALKSDGEPCPPEVAFLLGADGVLRYEALQAHAFRGSVLLRDAGVAVLRGGDGYLCLSSGPNGQGGCGGHAHNDKNGVEVSWGPTDLVVDRGTFVYARDPAERNRRRATAAHSTVQVDGAEQNRILPWRLFALPDTARARIVRLERRGGVQLAVGEHRGYERLVPGVLHRRAAALLPRERAFAIVDELRGSGDHVFAQRWFVPHTQVEERPAAPEELARLEELRLRGFARDRYAPERCIEISAGGRPVALFCFGGSLPFELSLEATDVSPGYGELLPARQITLRAAGEVPCALSCAILVLA